MRKVLTINGDITDKDGVLLVFDILKTTFHDEITEIVLVISSKRGSVCAITPICEALKMTGKKITVIGMQFVQGVATAIFMMAGRRILLPNTEFIIDRWSKSHKEVKKIGFVIPQQSVNADKDDKNVLYETLFMNSTLTFEVLEKNIDNKDWHLTSEEVKKYNIITEDYNMEEVKKLLTEDIWRDKDK